MTYTHQDEEDKRLRRIVITTIVVFTFIIAAVVHAADKNAVVTCTQLVKQADTYQDFYLPAWQKKMCDHAGIEVVVRFSKETLEEMANEAVNNREIVPDAIPGNVDEMKEWYQRQEHAREKAMAYLNLTPRLQRICACESVGRPDAIPQHYERDGVTVLTGRVTPEDTGMCQINTFFWGATAKSMGLDLFNPFDNVQMANYIYQQQGAQPWYPSKKCHGYDV